MKNSIRLKDIASEIVQIADDAQQRDPCTGRGQGTALQILVPPVTLRALKRAAVEQDTTVRTVVLEALAKAGYPVPADEIRDRRRAANLVSEGSPA